MNPSQRTNDRRGFTLVEMLVVIAIIALLLAVLLPAFATVREKAKGAATAAEFTALETGIRMFQQEAAIGGTLPPSAGDDSGVGKRYTIKDPDRDGNCDDVKITGAHLLVEAMMGADGLGTPGFKDIGKDGKTPPAGSPNGLWSDDTCGKTDSGIYALNTNGGTVFPRYPSSGSYVDDKMRDKASSLEKLHAKGAILNDIPTDVAQKQLMFLDSWDHPILYYKASPSSIKMITDASTSAGGRGIYWQEDNAIITGSDGRTYKYDGVDFGPGKVNNVYHELQGVNAKVPSTDSSEIQKVISDTTYDHSFARFIIDPSVKARPTPVQKDSYLLISAGPDARYGTGDDVLNWTRKTE